MTPKLQSWPATILIALALGLCAAIMVGCGPAKTPRKNACAGLVYKEYGLSREEYGGCAKAMVGKLDAMHEAVLVMGDAAKPKDVRMKAKGACFAANSGLARLIAEAGGREKLIYMQWADADLSRFNLRVDSARVAYLVYCYYGLTGREVVRMDSAHQEARDIAAALP